MKTFIKLSFCVMLAFSCFTVAGCNKDKKKEDKKPAAGEKADGSGAKAEKK